MMDNAISGLFHLGKSLQLLINIWLGDRLKSYGNMDAQNVLHWRFRSAVFNFPSRNYVSVMVCIFLEVGNSEL